MANEITAAEVTTRILDLRREMEPQGGSQTRQRVRAKVRVIVDTTTNFNYVQSTGIPISVLFTTDATKRLDTGIDITKQIEVYGANLMFKTAIDFLTAVLTRVTHVINSQPQLKLYQVNGGAAGLTSFAEFGDGTSIKGALGFNAAGPHVVDFEVIGYLRPGVNLETLGANGT